MNNFDTLVKTTRGDIPISEILPGDKLFSNKQGKSIVALGTYCEKDVKLYRIDFGNSNILIDKHIDNFLIKTPLLFSNRPVSLKIPVYIIALLIMYQDSSVDYPNISIFSDACDRINTNIGCFATTDNSNNVLYFTDRNNNTLSWLDLIGPLDSQLVNKSKNSPIIPFEILNGDVSHRRQFVQAVLDVSRHIYETDNMQLAIELSNICASLGIESGITSRTKYGSLMHYVMIKENIFRTTNNTSNIKSMNAVKMNKLVPKSVSMVDALGEYMSIITTDPNMYYITNRFVPIPTTNQVKYIEE